MRITTIFKKLLGVERTIVTGMVFDELGFIIDVKPRWKKPRCGICNKKGPIYDTQAPRLWRHLSFGRSRIWLRYTPRRVHCPHCGAVHVEAVPWALHASRFTRDFENMVTWQAQRSDKTTVQQLMGLSWRTVGRIIGRVVPLLRDKKRLDELYVIGVDEISYRKNHKYVTLVMDHIKRHIVWAREGKNADTLKAFFDELGPERCKQITVITMDMSKAFIKAVREKVPNAQIIFDRFHVQQLTNKAVDDVRRSIMQELAGTDEAQFIKSSRWALLKNPWNLSRKQRVKLRDVQRENKRLYRAYLLKEELARILDYLQPKRAMEAMKEWLSWASRSKLRPFVKLARTIRKYKDDILAYIKLRYTNGPTEALNNKARLIQRKAYGFHSANSFIPMMMLCCGGINVDAPLPNQPVSTHI